MGTMVTPEGLGFGIALDLDIDKMNKASEAIARSMKKIAQQFDSSVKAVKNFTKTINGIKAVESLIQKNKILNKLYYEGWYSFQVSKEKIVKGFGEIKKYASDTGSAISNVWDEIKEAKYKLFGLGLILADIIHLEYVMTKLSFAANMGSQSVDGLTRSSIGLSRELGIPIEQVERGYEAFAEYGKAILSVDGMGGKFARNTVKNALKMERAWGVALEDSIDLFDTLYKHFRMGERESKYFVNALKSISKATGVSMRDLIHFNKEILNINKAFGKALTPQQSKEIDEYAARFQQLGGNVSQLTDIYTKLQSNVTKGEIAELFGRLDLPLDLQDAKNFKEIGLSMGKMLDVVRKSGDTDKLRNLTAQLGQLGFGAQDINALVDVYNNVIPLKKETANLDRDYAKLLNTNQALLQSTLLEIRSVGQELSSEFIPAMKKVAKWTLEVSKSFSKWFRDLSPGRKKIIAVTLAVIALSGAILAVGKALKVVFYGAASNPYVLGALLLAAAIYKIYENWDKVKAAFSVSNFKETLMAPFSQLSDLMGSLSTKFMDGMNALKDWGSAKGSNFFSGITNNFKSLVKSLSGFGIKILDIVTAPFREAGRVIKILVSAMKMAFSGHFSDAQDELGRIFSEGLIGKGTRIARAIAGQVSMKSSEAAEAFQDIEERKRAGVELTSGQAKFYDAYTGIKSLSPIMSKFADGGSSNSELKKNTAIQQEQLEVQKQHLEETRKKNTSITVNTGGRSGSVNTHLGKGVQVGTPVPSY